MTISIKQGIVITKMGNSCVVYDNEDSTLHELNDTAFIILNGIEKKKSEKSILKEILFKYEADENRVKQDYNQLLKDLLKKKIIVSK